MNAFWELLGWGILIVAIAFASRVCDGKFDIISDIECDYEEE